MHINDLLKIAVERKSSDLHLKVGAFPDIRVDGTLLPLADMRRLMSYEGSGAFQLVVFFVQGRSAADSVSNGWQMSGGPASAGAARATKAAERTSALTLGRLNM